MDLQLEIESAQVLLKSAQRINDQQSIDYYSAALERLRKATPMNELTTLNEIKAAILIGPVFCDIVNPAAKGLPARNVRKYYQGRKKDFEVLVLEGWYVPERVYTK